MMKAVVFSLAVLLMPIFAEAATPAWHIVSTQSSLTFTATQNDSPVSGEFKKFTGEVKFDPAQLSTSSAHIVVDINSITTSYSEVGDTLKTSDWFDVKLYPQAALDLTQFSKTGSNQYQAHGMLTIRDKTVPVIVTFILDEYSQTKAHAKGTTTLKRTAFGLGKGDWAKTDAVKDDVRVDFVVTAERT